MPEIRRLVLLGDADPTRQAFLLGWSRWRRTHQAIAQRCHTARHARARLAPQAAPAPPPVRGVLTDAEWTRVRPVLPPQKPPVGRSRHDHRTVLSGILWVLRTASPWREMPPQFGHWDTAYARYRLWCTQGLWQRIVDALGPPAVSPVPSPDAGVRHVSL